MKGRIRFVAAALLLLGATQQSMSAQNTQTRPPCPVIYPDRIWLRGFSVQPPVGDRWCLAALNAGNWALVYWRETGWETETGWERPPRVRERTHGFLTWARLDDVDGGVPKSIADLTSFAEKWISAGGTSVVQLSGKTLLTLKRLPGAALKRGSVVRDDSLGMQCVRYDLEIDERHNKLLAGRTLTYETIGFLCLDLMHPDELIDLSYSELFVKDERPAASLMSRLKPEADAFFRSVWIYRPHDALTVKRYTAAAEAGSVQAQFGLALHFQLEWRFVDAAKWFRTAAEKGHAGAQNNLAAMYAEGKGGLSRDAPLAAHWFRLSAEQGVPEAQYRLAGLYLLGDGVEKDVTEGMKWLRRAADQGFPMAQISLGKRYQEGDGVQWNPVRAYIWLKLGLWRAMDADERKLAEDLLKKLTLALTPNQVVYAERRAAAWRPGEE